MLPPFLKGAPKMSINYVYDSQNQRYLEPKANTEPSHHIVQYNEGSDASICCSLGAIASLSCFLAFQNPIGALATGAPFCYAIKVIRNSEKWKTELLIRTYVAQFGWRDFTEVTPPPGSRCFVVNHKDASPV